MLPQSLPRSLERHPDPFDSDHCIVHMRVSLRLAHRGPPSPKPLRILPPRGAVLEAVNAHMSSHAEDIGHSLPRFHAELDRAFKMFGQRVVSGAHRSYVSGESLVLIRDRREAFQEGDVALGRRLGRALRSQLKRDKRTFLLAAVNSYEGHKANWCGLRLLQRQFQPTSLALEDVSGQVVPTHLRCEVLADYY